jgi:hypothetical protein
VFPSSRALVLSEPKQHPNVDDKMLDFIPEGRSSMPWTSNDAERHTRKANTSELKELWAKVANESLERTGNEGRAIREANAVVGRQAKSS